MVFFFTVFTVVCKTIFNHFYFLKKTKHKSLLFLQRGPHCWLFHFQKHTYATMWVKVWVCWSTDLCPGFVEQLLLSNPHHLASAVSAWGDTERSRKETLLTHIIKVATFITPFRTLHFWLRTTLNILKIHLLLIQFPTMSL